MIRWWVLIAALVATPVVAVMPRADAKGFSPATEHRLATIVQNQMTDDRIPGATVAVWAPGRSWIRSFGFADRADGAPMRVRDHVRIASITKTFTATAILRLVDQGRISLDDPLSTYVPDMPNGDRITVRNLLGMTSGLFDFTADKAFAARFDENPLMTFTPQQVVALVRRRPPDFAPGAEVRYADTNYTLLGIILEKVTGQTAEEAIRDLVIVPAGLRHTSFPTTPALPRPFAHGYWAGADGNGPLLDYTRSNPGVAWTAGGMVSTVGDLRRWAGILAAGTLLTPATEAARTRWGTVPNPGGPPIGYGLGVFRIGQFEGHNGAIFGYNSAAFHLPGRGVTVVVVANQSTNSSGSATAIFAQVAAALYPRALAR